jgi:hypothetical protein
MAHAAGSIMSTLPPMLDMVVLSRQQKDRDTTALRSAMPPLSFGG